MRAPWMLLAFLAGCGSTATSSTSSSTPAPEPTTETTTTEAPPSPAASTEATTTPVPSPTTSTASYELHEWGVVDVPSDGTAVELAAGAGRVDRPMAVRKPVVYVHLLDGATEATFGLRVALSSGSIVEHFPPATFTSGGLEWPSIVARSAHGTASRWAADSSRRAPRACATPDGVCEITELPRYDAPSAAGLDVGGTESGLLFYRASLPSLSLPLTAVRGPDLAVRVTASASMAGAPGSILRLSTNLSGPWPRGHVVVSRAAFPAPGASVDLSVGTTALTREQGIAELGQSLAALGLTPDETAAFMAGWSDELFGADASEARDLSAQGPRLQDVLLFFLPEASVDAITRLEATPPPRAIRRAFLIRIDLGPVTTA